MENNLLVEINNKVAALILNRPQVHNAFDDNLINALHQALLDLKQNPQVLVVVLQSKGDNFSAGADLNWMKQMAAYSAAENCKDAAKLEQLLYDFKNFPKPTVVRVQGGAFGGALGLIACADIAIATNDSKFCFSEAKLGLVPAVISPYVVQAIGKRQAERLFLTAEVFNAEVAAAIGLIHQQVATTALDETVNKTVSLLLKNGPKALATIKELLRRVGKDTIDNATREYTSKLIAEVRVSPEGQEGLAAFLQKRKPNWLEENN